jgi:predicted metal-dependent hydrolase
MPFKIINNSDLGEIRIYKRSGTDRLSIRMAPKYIRVTQPKWMPFSAGEKFVAQHREWILKNIDSKKEFILENGLQIGKQHILYFEESNINRKQVKDNQIIIKYNSNEYKYYSHEIQQIAKQAVKQALIKEAKQMLPNRVNYMANEYDFEYKEIKIKSMKSRWGSCNNDKIISLNCYLMELPWHIIDYVILHELCHTKHLNHSSAFWSLVATYMPDYKIRKKEMHTLQAKVHQIQF